MFYLEASSFSCLHISTSFLSLQPYGLGGLSPVSRGGSASRAPWTPQTGRLPWFHWLDYRDCARSNLMNSWAQLLFGLSPFDNLPSSGSPLPQLLLLLFFFWDYKWYYWLLVHYTKIVNLYGYQLFNYCHQILTIKLILYKIMFKLYYIIYHIIKVVTHLVIVPIECALAFYYIFQYFFLMWCGTL